MGRIVVGVDGSEGARQALRWAAEEARNRGDTLEVVHAWQVPYSGPEGSALVAVDLEVLERAAEGVLDAALTDADPGDVPVRRTVVCGAAAPALLERGKGADLVVVGSRGRGGFVGLLLGSISHQVIHHAPCPVVVVPVH